MRPAYCAPKIPVADIVPNMHRYYIDISVFAIATPASDSVPKLLTVILFTRLTELVTTFCIIIGTAIRNSLL